MGGVSTVIRRVYKDGRRVWWFPARTSPTPDYLHQLPDGAKWDDRCGFYRKDNRQLSDESDYRECYNLSGHAERVGYITQSRGSRYGADGGTFNTTIYRQRIMYNNTKDNRDVILPNTRVNIHYDLIHEANYRVGVDRGTSRGDNDRVVWIGPKFRVQNKTFTTTTDSEGYVYFNIVGDVALTIELADKNSTRTSMAGYLTNYGSHGERFIDDDHRLQHGAGTISGVGYPDLSY